MEIISTSRDHCSFSQFSSPYQHCPNKPTLVSETADRLYREARARLATRTAAQLNSSQAALSSPSTEPAPASTQPAVSISSAETVEPSPSQHVESPQAPPERQEEQAEEAEESAEVEVQDIVS